MDEFEQSLEEKQNKISLKFGNFVTYFIIFLVFAVMTTDVKVNTFVKLAELGLSFFIILVASNLCYLTNFSNGIAKAKLGEIYTNALGNYIKTKKQLSQYDWRDILEDFCQDYIDKELERTRKNILSNAGVKYSTYIEEYIGKDKDKINKLPLTSIQKKAINKANKIKPIVLTPEMLYKIGRDGKRRTPLGEAPDTKRAKKKIGKVAKTTLTAFVTSLIALEFALTPSWEMFCMCLVKLYPVVSNCFIGYKDGIDSVEIDTVNYMNDQADLMCQAMQFKGVKIS
jgi:hypothetical protein